MSGRKARQYFPGARDLPDTFPFEGPALSHFLARNSETRKLPSSSGKKSVLWEKSFNRFYGSLHC